MKKLLLLCGLLVATTPALSMTVHPVKSAEYYSYTFSGIASDRMTIIQNANGESKALCDLIDKNGNKLETRIVYVEQYDHTEYTLTLFSRSTTAYQVYSLNCH